VADLLFPGRCACGAPAAGLCPACAAAAHPPPSLAPPSGVAVWAAPFAYEGPVRELVARAKYRNQRAGTAWLADHMVAAIVEAWVAAAVPVGGAVDVVTWPPTTAARRRARGFDQAELLARAVGRRLGVPTRGLLARVDDRAQTGARLGARLAGPRLVARRAVPGGAVLVVDDVATTGSTLRAAAAALAAPAGGAARVDALTAARTPPRPGAATGSR
jgi:predicted amidophosphoribosyltransferase